MSTIRVQRMTGGFGVLRKLKISVDGKRAGSIREGTIVDIDVPAGEHRVRVRMDWARSRPLVVQCADQAVVTVEVHTPGYFTAGMESMLAPGTTFELRLADES